MIVRVSSVALCCVGQEKEKYLSLAVKIESGGIDDKNKLSPFLSVRFSAYKRDISDKIC